MKRPAFHALCVLVLPAALAVAQAPSSPKFEAASIKPNMSADVNRRLGVPANRFEATNMPLRVLVQFAYGDPGPPAQPLPESRLIGGPGWLGTDRFDIRAVVPIESAPSATHPADVRLMLQALLEERFRLKLHRETRDSPIYELVLARSDGQLGPQIHRSTVDCQALIAARAGGPPPATPPPPQSRVCQTGVGLAGTVMVNGQTMSTFASVLTRMLDRTVVDRTGLSGVFDLDATFNPESAPGMQPPPGVTAERPATDAPSLFSALQEQLGLKLQPARGAVDVFVIDSAERPTDN